MALYFSNRRDNLLFLKRLWAEEETVCPKCRAAALTFLHRGAKKSNNDWHCPACGEIFRTIHMLYELNDTYPE